TTTSGNLEQALPLTTGQQNISSDQSNIPQFPVQSSNIPTTDIERRAMFDMMNELRSGFKLLQHELEEERRARRQLESQIQRLIIATAGK
ncbi:unnamed protein product, partial [Adineta steineri]